MASGLVLITRPFSGKRQYYYWPILLADLIEKPFHGIKPTVSPRAVLVAARFYGRFELFQQVFLLARQVNRCLNSDLSE